MIAGVAFAVAWLPCTGPTLGAILTAASTEGSVGEGGVLLAFYALGLAVPFLLCAVAFSSVSGFFRFFRDHYAAITVVSGVVLVVMGVLLYTNELTRLNSEALDADGRPRDQLLQRPVGRRRYGPGRRLQVARCAGPPWPRGCGSRPRRRSRTRPGCSWNCDWKRSLVAPRRRTKKRK